MGRTYGGKPALRRRWCDATRGVVAVGEGGDGGSRDAESEGEGEESLNISCDVEERRSWTGAARVLERSRRKQLCRGKDEKDEHDEHSRTDVKGRFREWSGDAWERAREWCRTFWGVFLLYSVSREESLVIHGRSFRESILSK